MEFWLVASNPPTVRPGGAAFIWEVSNLGDGGLLELESHECAVGIIEGHFESMGCVGIICRNPSARSQVSLLELGLYDFCSFGDDPNTFFLSQL